MKEAPEIDDSRGFQIFLLILVRGRLVLDLPIDGTDDKHPAQRHFYSHSIVKNYLRFAPVCRSLYQFVLLTPCLKNCRESMGPNLGHGFRGGAGRYRGSRRTGEAPRVISGIGKPMSCPWFEELKYRPVRGPDAKAGAGRCSVPPATPSASCEASSGSSS